VKSGHGEKAQSSIHHSKLSGPTLTNKIRYLEKHIKNTYLLNERTQVNIRISIPRKSFCSPVVSAKPLQPLQNLAQFCFCLNRILPTKSVFIILTKFPVFAETQLQESND
jgi:hypothetical protein